MHGQQQHGCAYCTNNSTYSCMAVTWMAVAISKHLESAALKSDRVISVSAWNT